MTLRDRLLRRGRVPEQVAAAPAPLPTAVPEPSPTAALALDKDWGRLATMGAEGHQAMVDALHRIADLPPAARRYAPPDPDPHATFPLVLALVARDEPDVPALFTELLEECPEESDPLHGCLLEGLARTGSRLGVETLLTHALRRAGSTLRNPAANLLAEHPSPSTVPTLLAHLADDAPRARALVADVLGQVPDSRSAEPLVAALDDPDPAVRDVAASALGKIGDQRALLPLLLAEERDRRTRRWGHLSTVFDGHISPRLLAIDSLVTGTEPDRVAAGEDAIALEEQILERTEPTRNRYAAQVEAALGGTGHPQATALSAEVLTATLARSGVVRRGEHELVYADDRGADLELDLHRCAVLGRQVAGPLTSDPVDDPQGGQMWDETWTVECADGPLVLTITRRYTPMY